MDEPPVNEAKVAKMLSDLIDLPTQFPTWNHFPNLHVMIF